MTDSQRPTRNERLERFLDGLLNDGERAEFDELLRADPTLQPNVELQERIDASLIRQFRTEAPTPHRIADILSGATRQERPAPRSPATMWWWAAGMVAAAAIAWLLATTMLQPSQEKFAFASRPLPDLYREALANGFEPVYHCGEADRFADTFSRRQGQPLKLLVLPTGVKMMGLSYPGGLSRDTTAMLCRVDGKPVMVFVDRLDADQPNASDHGDKSVRVFRSERDGLVFYEISPLDASRVSKFLVPQSAAGASELPDSHAAL